jgi:predicted  nucleic acid-binding Zn-ribbon protein
MTGGRAVSVIDYQEYRKLEDKRDRIMLKKTLYERKKVSDETQVVILNEELNQYQRNKDELTNRLSALRKQLNNLQKDIVTVDKTRKREMHNVEQEKRRDIIKRAGREVPY